MKHDQRKMLSLPGSASEAYSRRCSCVESANSPCVCVCVFNARAYRHTVTRACVHFHRRARRNCKVAYMQGVKLGSRRFDPRPRIEISIRCNSSEIPATQRTAFQRVPAAVHSLFDRYRFGIGCTILHVPSRLMKFWVFLLASFFWLRCEKIRVDVRLHELACYSWFFYSEVCVHVSGFC